VIGSPQHEGEAGMQPNVTGSVAKLTPRLPAPTGVRAFIAGKFRHMVRLTTSPDRSRLGRCRLTRAAQRRPAGEAT
jgi:hypothetical protein